jgi:hypothetical protein
MAMDQSQHSTVPGTWRCLHSWGGESINLHHQGADGSNIASVGAGWVGREQMTSYHVALAVRQYTWSAEWQCPRDQHAVQSNTAAWQRAAYQTLCCYCSMRS